MKTFREIVLSDSENTAKKQIARRNLKPFTFLFLLLFLFLSLSLYLSNTHTHKHAKLFVF